MWPLIPFREYYHKRTELYTEIIMPYSTNELQFENSKVEILLPTIVSVRMSYKKFRLVGTSNSMAT